MARERSNAAITASAIRKRLKKEFPEVEFSVRSSVYSTHDSITVYWTDGPIDSIVDEVLKEYQAGEFDGMTDSYTYTGIDPALGCSGVDYVSSSRTVSRERKQELADYVRQHFTEIPDTWKDIYQETGIDHYRVERNNPETWSQLNRQRYEAMQQRREEADIERQRDEWNKLKAYEESRKAAAEWSAEYGEVQNGHTVVDINPSQADEIEVEPEPDPEFTGTDENPQDKPDYPLYSINESAAKLAKTMNSYYDYVPGSATAEYQSKVAEAAALAEECKTNRPEDAEKIDARLDRYSRQLAVWYNRHFQIESYCPSMMISGGGEFPTGKKERQNAMRDRHMKEWDRVQHILEGLRPTAQHIISADDPAARERLRSKLEALQAEQELMKRVNAYYRKFGTCVGCEGISAETAAQLDDRVQNAYSWERQPFAPYTLTNNNANIKRIEQRIHDLERMSEKADKGWEFAGGRVEMNPEIMRIQVFFDDIPDVSLRSEMKHHGFRWAPSQKAWQRQLTDNSIRAAKQIQALAPLEGIPERIPEQETGPVVGRITYYDTGEVISYFSEQEYLSALKEAYNVQGINGWKHETMLSDSRLRRMVKEIERDEHGLEPISEERQGELRVQLHRGIPVDEKQLTPGEIDIIRFWESEMEARKMAEIAEAERRALIEEVPQSRYPALWEKWKNETAVEWREDLTPGEAVLIEEWDKYQPDYMPMIAPEILAEQVTSGCSQTEAEQLGLYFYRATTDISVDVSVMREMYDGEPELGSYSTRHKSQIPANSLFITDVYGRFISMTAPSEDFDGQGIGEETGQHIYLQKSWREQAQPITLDEYAGLSAGPVVDTGEKAPVDLRPEDIDAQYNQRLQQLQQQYNQGLQQVIDCAVSAYSEKIQRANAAGDKLLVGEFLQKIVQLKKGIKIPGQKTSLEAQKHRSIKHHENEIDME